MKSSEIPEKEGLEDTRYSLGFEKKEKNNSNINIIQIQPSIKDNRARSAKPFLLRKYIPKLKPVKSNLVPTTMHLEGETEISSLKKYKKKNKNDINVVAEEDYEKAANSGDERFSYNNIYSNNDKNFSSDDDNEIINKDLNIINTDNNNIKLRAKKIIKKTVRNNIDKIRRFMIKTKEKMILKKYCDDTSVITNTSFKDYFRENYGNKWHEKIINLNNELISDTSFDYDFDFYKKKKSKSIYVGNNKYKNRPPILGFLQMNENSANTTLSSGFSEI